AVTASPVEEDVPPTALPGGGVTSQQPIAPPAGSPQASSLVHSSIPAAAPAPLMPIQLPRADGETKSANPNVAERPPEIPRDAKSNASALDAQVDAYIQGPNLDRTQLYQNWNRAAGYVVDGFRNAVAYNSP